MDPFTFIPDLAKDLGIAPSSLVFCLFILYVVLRAISRRIPDDATGAAGWVRTIAGALVLEVDNRLTSGVTVKDAAKAAMQTPPITDKLEAETGATITPTPAPETR